MIYGYMRVSTKAQNLNRQEDALLEFGVEKDNIFADKESGKDFDREKYQEMKSILKRNDVLVIKELDRLGRNKKMVKEELEYFKNNGIRVKILNIPTTLIDFPEGQEWIMDMINNILLEVMSSIDEEERRKIKTRQAEGIAAAKAGGVKFGPKVKYTEVQLLNALKDLKVNGGTKSYSQVVRDHNIPKTTLIRYSKQLSVQKEANHDNLL